MPRPFKTALVVLAVIGSLALAPSPAIADGLGDATNSGGASGCCRTAPN
ncbi:hypothetical protein HP550_05610 [Cellulomonas humilata]|uniref:Uncharacterized protein n=1 Tax=Cellulomonas humilata TaxID=144055 RepID=A0A7Y5ZZ03_9CELL|nr:hypothetical protein [Cellulomonas humilata]NUU16724.1 hypothetical protein [Cellulomonas humilata]